MVSLISSMAEELKGGQPQVKPFVPVPMSIPIQIVPTNTPTSKLIPVSDGEESEDTDSENDDSESGENSSTYSDSDDDDNIIEIIGSVEELKEMDEPEIDDLEEFEGPKELNVDDIKSIHLEDSLGSLSDLSLFKSIHISGAESDTQTDSITIEESTSYKKMPIQKLREIAQIQGHGDVSKLKKNELLKLLGAE
jgi:hypothetical protein